MDSETHALIFSYLYGHECTPLSFDEADSLLLLGEKYNVQGLVNICKKYIIKWMTPARYIRVAILGYLCNDRSLKKAAADGIQEIQGKKVSEIEDWNLLEKYPKLMMEMFEMCMSSESRANKRRRLQ